MRIPFPERIPLHGAAIFAIALAAIQWMEGTPIYFCAGCVAFILIATLAFNSSGGLTRASGAYIFFYSVLVVVIGITYKAFLGERADSNLADPIRTVQVYVAGISAMLLAAFVSRRFARKTGLLDNLLKDSQMYRSSIGCFIVGGFGSAAIGLLGSSGSQIQSIFLQLNDLIPLGVILGVIYEIRQSGGRRSMNVFVAVSMAYYFLFFGLLSFSKQGLLTPLFSYFIAAWSQRYRFSKVQALSAVLLMWVIFRYLTPFVQYGRGVVNDTTTSERIDMVIRLVESPEATRQENLADTSQGRGLNSYYNHFEGFWERLQFVSVDDALINVTDQGKVFGLMPIKGEALNAIPHVFWPSKPSYNFGNMYAHEIGGFNEEDTTTGISFSPTSEAYHLAQWTGVLVVAPLLWLVLFIVYDSLFGDLRRTPWGLLAAVFIAHIAPEGGITGVVRLLTFGVEIFVFCALFAVWVAPLIASGIVAPAREKPADVTANLRALPKSTA